MSYSYLLDTNILSDFIKHPTGKIFSQIQDVGEEKICTSIIVACELRFGAEKSNSFRLKQRIDLAFSIIPVLPLIPDIDHNYAIIRTHLERLGTPIGSNDLLIAVQAYTLNLILITANIREFSRVPNLKVENWLKPD
ncbi:type II toxin-antitoxin system VapC family toxin [Anabaena cylindrica FACHB-243]|uniref:PilT protein domain protein n=1 Tax=Anabaena cylindrica (strain ATCC 27899 / PCC 7122) TaxID=272123 RepID=K9ZEJ5_ANACC|nr:MULTISPECIES: type II toxin-antitoxin system VapC family toxin [Anabaena]AFZ56770.1 PilT protein domain protein [Anabaena cylindrica PCC 7122]MBD2420732.1 type II toxin-antitoxin system VapC family toxin [Anabaena cylindrica FACHB-243]MBY5285715.1 type II toxin-antitoxin system VapC family toxin [Anabaena sp. CCAP 1446/1C]MBY5311556.1 type II toxin-antitoxin system VapC family toxin [Anabaena sp. CCAP 1446/1C]MCM2410010.1 type II toxin-antitoxin system VapC family toxin [Anabaena sp. CCAP 1